MFYTLLLSKQRSTICTIVGRYFYALYGKERKKTENGKTSPISAAGLPELPLLAWERERLCFGRVPLPFFYACLSLYGKIIA